MMIYVYKVTTIVVQMYVVQIIVRIIQIICSDHLDELNSKDHLRSS